VIDAPFAAAVVKSDRISASGSAGGCWRCA